MAINFKISLNKNNNGFQLNLMGDFDGSSAFELVNTLKKYTADGEKIYINTGGLSHLYPFGVEVFKKKCPISKLYHDLIFTGEHATEITPF